MQINNPFQTNDWEIKKFLKVILAIQLAMWGVIGLDAVGLQIPIIRQFIGFIYLTFIPGIISLRILKLHKLGNIETLLYTVGLSIATLMFTGLFMNTVYPFLGISGPISPTPLIITISIIVLVLCILSYVRDKNFSDPSFIDVKDVLSPPVLFLCLIPFLSIFGTYLVNFHHTNILLMLLIVVIALVVLLIGFDKFIPKNLYPLAVFVIALSILFYQWLISMYLTGWDVHHELYLSNLVTTTAHWDSTIPFAYNAMLSIVMLAPIFSNICSMNFTWVFKIIYPLLFSLVPLGLYRVFQKQTDDKIAFLACFYFVSVASFWTITSRRQWTAELFLVLLITAMIDKDMNKIKRAFLSIVFGVSLVVSHYGTSYIYMLCLISACLILILMDNLAIQKSKNNFFAKISKFKNKEFTSNPITSNAKNRTISSTFVILFITFVLTWYMYVSSSSAFNIIIRIGDHIASSIFTDFLNPEAAEGLERLMTKPHPGLLHRVHQVINYLNQIFIVIGGIVLLLKHKELKFEKEYVAFSMVNLGMLFAAISVPYFASPLNMERAYHITLLFLAPFCVIGGITVFRLLSKVVRVTWTDQRVRTALKVLSVYFVIFLLYQTGFVFQVTEGHSGSASLSQEWIREQGDMKIKGTFYNWYVPEQNVFGARWLSENMEGTTRVYADQHYSKFLLSYGMFKIEDVGLLSNTTKVDANEYIFLRYFNVKYGVMRSKVKDFYNVAELSPILNEKNKIYTNGGSYIYR